MYKFVVNLPGIGLHAVFMVFESKFCARSAVAWARLNSGEQNALL
jgi:hypothetical protein